MKPIICFLCLASLTFAETPKVTTERLPDGAIQPQVAVDANGTVHLVTFRGDPAKGDLYHQRRAKGERTFSSATRVNHQSGDAIAVGSIRGAQLAVGRNGRVHVAWNGSGSAKNHVGAAMWYARSGDAGQGFEPERDLITHAAGLDGGGAVAADQEGRVWVFWHAAEKPDAKGEVERTLWVAQSDDDGKTFAKERRVVSAKTGACGCCGMEAWADGAGGVHALFRGAETPTQRDALLVSSKDHGATFAIVHRSPWEVATCPMSSAAFASGGKDETLVAWETSGQVHWAAVAQGKVVREGAPAGQGKKRKHPVIASMADGGVLLAWTEGTGWQRGGSLAWQFFDRSGQAIGQVETRPGVPVWGLPALIPSPDGGWTILH